MMADGLLRKKNCHSASDSHYETVEDVGCSACRLLLALEIVGLLDLPIPTPQSSALMKADILNSYLNLLNSLWPVYAPSFKYEEWRWNTASKLPAALRSSPREMLHFRPPRAYHFGWPFLCFTDCARVFARGQHDFTRILGVLLLFSLVYRLEITLLICRVESSWNHIIRDINLYLEVSNENSRDDGF